MGGDIAAWCALQGFSVTLQDRQHDTLARAYKRANGLFGQRLKDRRLAQHARDRFVPDLDGDGIKRADVIIEAIFEDVDAKRSLFQDVEPQMKPDAILATNTSSIPLEELATVLQRPERLVGLHFFNPVAKMPLVEIVHGKKTNPATVQDAASFTKAIGRLPLPVTSTPGFLVNRILMPYLIEAVTLLQEGVPPVLIDKAAVDFGMPMGPIELADTVGLDICFHVANILSKSMDIAVPDRLSELVDRKQLGKKTGYGFYKFKSGKPVKPDVEKGYTAPADLQDRLILRLLNEAVGCLHDGVVETADQLDAGVVFGTGFAPFRGGPINYIMNRGVEQLSQTLQNLQKKHGDRFASNPGWQELKNKELEK
jgi:3-hydroxyacyl-CoA dehydrogenase/enoyl-CoA hydratase/3-hydroxybutyryl-CoA epimerase